MPHLNFFGRRCLSLCSRWLSTLSCRFFFSLILYSTTYWVLRKSQTYGYWLNDGNNIVQDELTWRWNRQTTTCFKKKSYELKNRWTKCTLSMLNSSYSTHSVTNHLHSPSVGLSNRISKLVVVFFSFRYWRACHKVNPLSDIWLMINIKHFEPNIDV